MLKKYLKPAKVSDQVSLAILILRIGMALMIPHGYDKLVSLLGGANDFPDPLGVSPRISHGLTVFAEFFCSILLVLGLSTRLASLVLIILALVIAFGIHLNDPLGDKEHALLYLFSYITIFIIGAGKYSLDSKIFK